MKASRQQAGGTDSACWLCVGQDGYENMRLWQDGWIQMIMWLVVAAQISASHRLTGCFQAVNLLPSKKSAKGAYSARYLIFEYQNIGTEFIYE